MSDLHAQIMNIPCVIPPMVVDDQAYRLGHRDARHAAAELALAADARVKELEEALTRVCRSFPTDTDMAYAGWEPAEIEEACSAYDIARAALKGKK